MIHKTEVMALKERISYLEGIIDGTLKAWKLRHPEDFETSKDSKLIKYEGGNSTLCVNCGTPKELHPFNSETISCNIFVPQSKGCRKEFVMNGVDWICGDTYYHDIMLCKECKKQSESIPKEDKR